MLKADGFRLFRVMINSAVIEAKRASPAVYTRSQCQRKGLVLDSYSHNPMMPFRYRMLDDGVVWIEQMQNITGTFAGVPPEQPDFFERFVGGEGWVGVVKTVKVT